MNMPYRIPERINITFGEMEKETKAGKKPVKNQIFRTIVIILIVSAIATVQYIVTKGVPLFDTPKPDQIVKVVVTSRDFPGEIKEYTEGEPVELAVKLVNFLNYRPFTLNAGAGSEPVISIRYFLSDGSETEVAASAEIVWYDGKSYELKVKEKFAALANAVFFMKENAGGGEFR